jgi:hypothetical protein
VVGRDDVFAPKRKLVVIVPVVVIVRIVVGVRMGCEARGCVHKRNERLNIREKFSTEKRLFPENAHPHVNIASSGLFARLDLPGTPLLSRGHASR